MNLEELIKNRQAKTAIIGMGYVGLPHALEIARAGMPVCGIDIQQKRIDQLNAGESYIQDVKDNELQEIIAAKKFEATTDFSKLAEADVIIICVPTPLDKYKIPDISYIVNSANEIKKYLRPGQLVILESTTYPGTTDEVILPMMQKPGLKAGRDFYLAFAPERIDPGNIMPFSEVPKVVGGITQECTKIASFFYSQFLKHVHPVSSTRAAEMTKILENTYRLINISAINELAMLAGKMNIDIWEVIEAAKTKPYGFQAFYPSPKVGGHCFEKNQKLFIKTNGGDMELLSIRTLFERCAATRDSKGSIVREKVMAGAKYGSDLKLDIEKECGPENNLSFNFPKNISLLSFDVKIEKTSFEEVNIISKRIAPRILELSTHYKHSLKVTDKHPVFVLENEKFTIKLAQNVEKGDYLVFSRRIPEIAGLAEIDVIAEIVRSDLSLVKKTRVRFNNRTIRSLKTILDVALKGNEARFAYYRQNCIPLELFLAQEKNLNISRKDIVLSTGRGPSFQKLPAIISINNDFARLIGYYISEGCLTKEKRTSRVRFSFHRKEKEYIDDVKSILENIGLKYSEYDNKKWLSHEIKISSEIFSLIFEKLLRCGCNCYQMRIPDALFFSTVQIRKEILKGILRGDGGVDYRSRKISYEKNGKSYSHNSNSAEVSYFTSSPILFEQVGLMLFELGVVWGKHARAGLLKIKGVDNLLKLQGLFGGEKGEKISFYLAKVKKDNHYGNAKIYDNFLAIKIKEIVCAPQDEVYSLEVENTNTLLTDSGVIVHNCIPLDPFYLSWKAKEYNFWAHFIELAGEINEQMPHYTVTSAITALNRQGKAVKGSKILVWGVAYKKDINDPREGAAYDVIPNLMRKGAVVDYFDPLIPEFRIPAGNFMLDNVESILLKSIENGMEASKNYDAVIILCDHSGFNYEDLAKNARIVIDTRNAVESREFENVYRF